jgi:hypothetical protein
MRLAFLLCHFAAMCHALGTCGFYASMPCSNVCNIAEGFFDCLRQMCVDAESTAAAIENECDLTNSQLRSLGCSCAASCSSIVSGGGCSASSYLIYYLLGGGGGGLLGLILLYCLCKKCAAQARVTASSTQASARAPLLQEQIVPPLLRESDLNANEKIIFLALIGNISENMEAACRLKGQRVPTLDEQRVIVLEVLAEQRATKAAEAKVAIRAKPQNSPAATKPSMSSQKRAENEEAKKQAEEEAEAAARQQAEAEKAATRQAEAPVFDPESLD